MRVCSTSMPSCSQKRASSLLTTARCSQMEMRPSGTQCWLRRGARPRSRASLIRASMRAVLAGFCFRKGSAEGRVSQKSAMPAATATGATTNNLRQKRRTNPREGIRGAVYPRGQGSGLGLGLGLGNGVQVAGCTAVPYTLRPKRKPKPKPVP